VHLNTGHCRHSGQHHHCMNDLEDINYVSTQGGTELSTIAYMQLLNMCSTCTCTVHTMIHIKALAHTHTYTHNLLQQQYLVFSICNILCCRKPCIIIEKLRDPDAVQCRA
jgi:hypothetical protein